MCFNVFLIFDVFNINMDFRWILVRLGGLLGTSWGVLGRLGGILGAKWPNPTFGEGAYPVRAGHHGASWRPLGAVLGRLGRILGASWRDFEKTLKKITATRPQKNLAWQWNGKRAYLRERFDFEALCCFVLNWRTTRWPERLSEPFARDRLQ